MVLVWCFSNSCCGYMLQLRSVDTFTHNCSRYITLIHFVSLAQFQICNNSVLFALNVYIEQHRAG